MAGLTVRGLRMTAGRGTNTKTILGGVDLDLAPGRITGVAGESGSGKTMTGLSILRLNPPGTTITGGEIAFDGTDLLKADQRTLQRIRGDRIAMVFQDPTAALHPMLNIGTQLTDHLRVHQKVSRSDALARAEAVLAEVRVPEPASALKKYPHQFSGGQLQRVAIASAIICEPEILIADEPTTALDVTVQAGILRLLRRLCTERELAIMLVTHDLGVMSSLADTVAVMRGGEVVEAGDRLQVITAPRHPYTRELIDSLPTSHLDDLDDVDGPVDAEERP